MFYKQKGFVQCFLVIVRHVMMYFSSCPKEGARDTDEVMSLSLSLIALSVKTLKILESVQ